MMGFGFLGLLGLIVLIYWISERETSEQSSEQVNRDKLPPLEIIARRYARGELTREEYQELKQDLM